MLDLPVLAMKILFVGQRGIPIFGNKGNTGREQRVELLATQLAHLGHTVFVMAAKPFVYPSIMRYNGVEIIHRGSVTYANTVNIWHLLDTLLFMRSERPDVVHVHGWRAGVFIRLMHWVNPAASYIWTIDTLPDKYARLATLVARISAPVCEAITAPTRQLQYLLLQLLKVRTVYIPDGYVVSDLPTLPLSRFGLRKGQYCVTTATTPDALRFVAQGYKRIGTKKPLIVFTDATAALHRMKRYFPFVTFVPEHSHRIQTTLIAGAATVIVAGNTVSHDTLFAAMDAGRAIVATTDPLSEEVLGVTAKFVKYGDIHGLASALMQMVKDLPTQRSYAVAAQRRAQQHFSAPRIMAEYLTAYRARVVKTIPLDSAIPRLVSPKVGI